MVDTFMDPCHVHGGQDSGIPEIPGFVMEFFQQSLSTF